MHAGKASATLNAGCLYVKPCYQGLAVNNKGKKEQGKETETEGRRTQEQSIRH